MLRPSLTADPPPAPKPGRCPPCWRLPISAPWPTPQTPASQGRPRRRARPHTPRASLPTPIRRRPDRAVPIHPASPAATCAPGGAASPTQPVPGDEHEPCPRTCPRRGLRLDRREHAGGTRVAAGWAGLPGEGGRAGGVHHPALIREMEPGATQSHTEGLAQPAPGDGFLIAPGGAGWLPLSLPFFLAPAMVARMRRDASWRLDFP
jgi:hypothetical protein